MLNLFHSELWSGSKVLIQRFFYIFFPFILKDKDNERKGKRHSTNDMFAIKTSIVEIRTFRESLTSTKEMYKKGEMN